jgi:hypothetical protein
MITRRIAEAAGFRVDQHAASACAIAALVAVLAGCAAQTATTPATPSAPSSPSAPSAPAAPAPPPPVNLQGFPPAYQAGFGDGCSTGRGAERKDADRFGKDGNYRVGWQDGLAQCKRR